MDRARVWPAFDDAWILHRDDDFVVVNKPARVPTQAADPGRPDDLVTRLREHLKIDYLGVHQRLDRDTSGVLLFTARREANATVAAQFEGRTVEKTYLACVTGWPADRTKITLRDGLAQGDDGKMRVAGAREKGAQLAVTHARILERKGDRTLLELVLETGRTHQARVQLAHAGAPIAGDPLYRGVAAPRLLLHARGLTLSGPGGKKMRFLAPVPEDFEAWLANGDLGEAIYDDSATLDRAVRRAVEARYGLGRANHGERETTAFRLINEGGDALPGLAVDVYGDHLVAQLYADEGGIWDDPARRARVLDRLDAIGADGIYLKIRPKQANTVVDTRREELAPKLPVRGTAAPSSMVIREEGLGYLVRLDDGLSTGIFLDQRENRRRVRELSAGSSVVNLFAYTCAFSVAAAAGGAWRTISVDASAAALDRGRENMEEAGLLETAEHTFIGDDVFTWLARAKARGDRHDLVLLDPPSYSSTKKRRFVASSDYPELAAAALAVLRPGGRLLACANHRGISHAKFRKFLFDAARLEKREVAQIKDLPAPIDFPPPLGGEVHLKSALLTLAR